MPRAVRVPRDTPAPPASGLCSCPECAPTSGASRREHPRTPPRCRGRSRSVSAGQRPFGKKPRKFRTLATRTPPNTPCSEIRGDADGEPETINEGSGETQQQRTASMRREGAPAKPSVIHVQVDRDRVPVVGPASATSSTVPHLRFTRHAAFRPDSHTSRRCYTASTEVRAQRPRSGRYSSGPGCAARSDLHSSPEKSNGGCRRNRDRGPLSARAASGPR